MYISKKTREIVYNKFNGLCAYTGKPLDKKWQVDHVTPVCMPIQTFNGKQQHNDIENLMPACSIVNHYKRSLDLDGFRKYMLNFHKRLAKLPKKTRIPKTEKRKKYMTEVGRLFDITPEKPFSGVFYFETLSEHQCKYCGCMTSQPDSECYARPEKNFR